MKKQPPNPLASIDEAKRLRQKKRIGLEFITGKVGEAEKSHADAAKQLAALEEMQVGERTQLVRARATQLIKGEEPKTPAESSTTVRVAAAREELEVAAATLQELRDMRAQAAADFQASCKAVETAVDAVLNADADAQCDLFAEALEKFKQIGHRLVLCYGDGLHRSAADTARLPPRVRQALDIFEALEFQANLNTPIHQTRGQMVQNELGRQRRELIDSEPQELESAA